MSEEERKTSEKIDLIVDEMNSISTESAIQHIGAEIKTNINLTVVEIVGSNNSQFNNEQLIKRTTYLTDNNKRRPSSTQLSDRQTKSIQKLVTQNPINKPQ
jgi:hypothetical protein